MPSNTWHPHAVRFGFLALLVVLLLGCSLGALSFGSYNATPGEIITALNPLHDPAEGRERSVHALMWAIRLPRVLGGMLVGAALAVCGATMQGMFRNPLADPGLIGVSSGAGLGAVLAIVFGALLPATMPAWLGNSLVPISAFAGAAAVTIIIYRISLVEGRVQVATMLLAGIAIGALVGAIIGYAVTRATDDQLRTLTFWNMGSLARIGWDDLTIGAPLVLGVVFALPFFAKSMNAMLLGDAEAKRLGVNVDLVKRLLIGLTALGVGASVASTGTIGFVGLVVPHLVRLCIGPDYRFLIPASALLGAALLVLSDLLARMLTAPAELPISIVTALLGGPFFLYMLMHQRKMLFS